MHTLGDYFSEEEKNKKFDESFVAGQVFYLHQSFLQREKDKYFLLVACTEPPSFFIINSKISDIAAKIPHLRQCQVLIDYANHESVVEHDCFINCAEPCKELSKEEIKKQVMGDPSRIKGKLSDTVMNLVYDAVMKAKKIPPNRKIPILEAIRNSLLK